MATIEAADLGPGEEAITPVPAADGGRDNLLIDELTERLDSLQLLRLSDPAAASDVLESFGTQGRVEEDIVKELSTIEPIAHPDRFVEAHRRAMRAFEVYDRNGPRLPSGLTGLPTFLRSPAAALVRVMIRMIVRKHQRALAGEVRQLYALREASAAVGSPEHRMLARARRQVDDIRSDLNKNPLPLPAFIGVGAAVSGTLSWVQRGLADEVGRLLVLGIAAVIGLAGFWCVVRAAGVARRRTRLSLDGPMKALWEVMGDAGALPSDKSRSFAVRATLVLIAVWVIIPVMIAMAIRTV
jgi:hypothetical protein